MSGSCSRIHLYWATGCTSCLRAKEFLERNDVSFVSHNVVENGAELDEMAELGMPQQVPIIRRGDDWSDAQVLSEVARIADIEHEAEPLPVTELYRRLDVILDAVQRHLEQLPKCELETNIPNRPRSYADLVYHIFSIPESFLEHEAGTPLESYKPEPEWANRSQAALATYGRNVRVRLHDWHESSGWEREWSETANVYYGEPSVHEFFERTTWHAGQHARQLEWVLENRLDIDVAEPIPQSTWEELPMPEKIWEAV